jgi:four helix bundle protein
MFRFERLKVWHKAIELYTVAKGSTFEVVSIATICQRRSLMTPAQYQNIYGRAEEISKMLTGLKRFSSTL